MILTDLECEQRWVSKSPENPIVIDSDEGKQVMEWLDKTINQKVEHQKPHYITFFKPFQSPVDFSMINNTQDLKNHNRQHNVEQVGNEYVNNANKYK